MGMDKVKEFAKNNWENLVEIGIVVAAEATILSMYRAYISRVEKKLFED